MNNQDTIIDKQMLISEVVSKLRHFAKLYGIKSIFIAGGYCREYYLEKIWRTSDIDVASAYHEQARQLGGLFASEILKTTPRFYERTGTAMIEYVSDLGAIKVEFQGDSIVSYMHNQEVKTWMQSQKIDNVPLMNNIYGRDFTINALIYSLNNGHLYDPTGKAIRDFERKRISSLLPAQMLIKYNPLVALRALRFSMQYGFFIDAELRIAIQEGGVENLQKSLSNDRILKEVVKVLKTDGTKALDLLKKYNLDRILLHPDIKNYLYLGTK